jgi:hypothetical protein
MRGTIQLDPETARKLRSLARKQNVSVDELLEAHIPGLSGQRRAKESPGGQDRLKAFDEWVMSFPKHSEPLDVDLQRSSFYRKR